MPLCRLEVVRIEGYGAGVMCPFAVKREVFCVICVVCREGIPVANCCAG